MLEEALPSIEEPEAGSRDPDSEQVGEMLEKWLSRPDWELEEMYDWLQGYYLPPVGHDEYPYVWIYRGLALIDQRGPAELELALRLSKVLRQKPDVSRPGTRPEEMLFNLLMLCASVSNSSQLGEPLFDIYERRALKGEWLGTDLRVALTAALCLNQIDKRLQPIWQAMIEGRYDDFLIGTPKHGLDGIAFMQPSEQVQDAPALPEIGYALKAISHNLQGEPDRRLDFGTYINEIVNTYPGRPNWDQELICLADQNHWPDWAVVSLPSLCIPCKQVSQKRVTVLIWEIYLPIVKELGFDANIEDTFCDNKILMLGFPNEAISFIHPFASVLEQRRLSTPLPTYSAVLGAVTDMMSVIEKLLLRAKQADGWGSSGSMVGSGETFLPILDLLHQNSGISSLGSEALVEARREILPKNKAGVKAAGV
jgi:hypothetical protein